MTRGGRPPAPKAPCGHLMGCERPSCVQPGHRLDVGQAITPGMRRAECSCGGYRSRPGPDRLVRKTWRAHVKAELGFTPPM